MFKSSLFTSICYSFFFMVERSQVRTIDSFFQERPAIVMNFTAASFSLEMSSTGQLPLCFMRILGTYILSSESVKQGCLRASAAEMRSSGCFWSILRRRSTSEDRGGVTLLVEFVELRAGEDDVALPVHGDDFLGVLAHEEVLAEDDVVEDAAHAEDVADGLRLRGHVLDVDDLGGHVAGSAAPHEEVVGVVGHGGQAEVDDDGLLAEDDVVGLEVAVDHVLPGHLGQSPQDALHYELALVDRVLGEVAEPPANRTALHVLQRKVDRVLGLVDALQLHQVRVVEHLGDPDLVDEGLLAVLLREGGLFAEGLDGHLLLVLEADAEVDSREVALAQPLFCLEEVVEVELVHDVLELHLPPLDFPRAVAVELLRVVVGADELDASGRSEDLLLGAVLRPQDLEDGVEADHESALGGLGLGRMVEDCFWGKHQDHGRGVVGLEEEGSGESGVGGEELVVLLEEPALLGEVHYIQLQYTTALTQADRSIAGKYKCAAG